MPRSNSNSNSLHCAISSNLIQPSLPRATRHHEITGTVRHHAFAVAPIHHRKAGPVHAHNGINCNHCTLVCSRGANLQDPRLGCWM